MHQATRPPLLFAFWLAATAPALAQGLPDTTRLATFCEPLVASELVHGLVVGLLDGEQRLVRGFGRLSPADPTTPSADTVFEIGSVSKVFTGLLLADAVARGLVALDDPVQKYLPDGVTLPMASDQPIELWHLATHSSGLPRLPDMRDASQADPYAHFDAATLHAALARLRLRREPGEKYEYSNLGFGLLGHVLTLRAEQPDYASLLRARITGPLGMPDTVVDLDADRKKRLAPPHDASGEPNHLWQLATLAGAGGIRSTMTDMLRFAAAQIDPPATLAAAVRATQQRHHDGQNGIAMGLGWHLARDGITFVHSGQTGGYHSYLAVVPSTRRAVCILTNSACGEVSQVGERLVQLLHRKDVEPIQFAVPFAVERKVLEGYVGTYRNDDGLVFQITLGARGLSAQLTGQPALRIHATAANSFRYREVDARITFEPDGATAEALTLHQNGRNLRFVRHSPGK